MTKKKIFAVSLLTSALVFGAFAIVRNNNSMPKIEKTAADTFTFVLDSSNNLGTGSGTKDINNAADWPISFEYSGITSAEGHFAGFTGAGMILNKSAIHAMQSIKAVFSGSGHLYITSGFGISSDLGEQIVYNYDSVTALSSNIEYGFNSELPSYFMLDVDNDIVIDSITIKYTCTLADNRSSMSYYNMTFAREEYAKQTPGYFRYWAGRSEWSSSQVTFKSGVVNDDSVNMNYGVTGADSSWGLQVFYKNNTLTNGTVYELSFDIEIDAAKNVTLNGHDVALTAGNNHVAIEYSEDASGLSFKMVVPTSASDGNDFSIAITNLKWDAIAGRVAIGFGGNAEALANPGTYFSWNDQWWCGSGVDIDKSYMSQDGSITLEYHCTGGACKFGFQFFYKNPDLTNNTSYVLSLDVNALTACNIYLVNSDDEGNLRALSAGNNSISITYTESSGLSSLAFIAPVTEGSANTFVLSNISWTPAA